MKCKSIETDTICLLFTVYFTFHNRYLSLLSIACLFFYQNSYRLLVEQRNNSKYNSMDGLLKRGFYLYSAILIEREQRLSLSVLNEALEHIENGIITL